MARPVKRLQRRFKRWGAELILIGDHPNGENINQGVGSEYPEALAAAVIKTRREVRDCSPMAMVIA